MSTNAIYFFYDKDTTNICAVYKHYDNYPEGAASHIEAAKDYAWKLPRFEADEFASAFVAANKNKDGGEIRLVPLFEHISRLDVMEGHKGCEYYYDITYDEVVGDLVVRTHEKKYTQIDKYIWVVKSYKTHQKMLRSFNGEEDCQGGVCGYAEVKGGECECFNKEQGEVNEQV